MDCEDSSNSLVYAASSKGYKIAKAIREGKLRVINN
jgi:hypothetical protein